HLVHRVVEVRRQSQTGPILTGARGHDEAILLRQRRIQFPRVERTGFEDHDRSRFRRIGMRPHLDAVELPDFADESLPKRLRAPIDHVAPDLIPELERLRERRELRVVALSCSFELLRDADRTLIETDHGRRDAILYGLRDEENTNLLR